MSQPTIELNHVSKLFYKQHQRTFKEMLPALFGGQKTIERFWALNNVTFKIEKGEFFGIVGRNGSGKSTLLKMIAGVSAPTKGSISLTGRIAPLIELGAGFHPELTGRENIYLNGVILGLKRVEVDAVFNDIVTFADLAEFIDEPIKHYSSGMYLRLAFSVAIHTNPEIILIDEILAVGDSRFQKKCFNVLRRFKEEGKTIVFVSHDMAAVKLFCDRCALLDHGDVKLIGKPSAVIRKYNSML